MPVVKQRDVKTNVFVEAVWVSMATVLQLAITWMNWGRP